MWYLKFFHSLDKLRQYFFSSTCVKKKFEYNILKFYVARTRINKISQRSPSPLMRVSTLHASNSKKKKEQT